MFVNGSYADISSFVNALNDSRIPYLIIRNYENMLSSEIFTAGHEDIDLLTTDSRLLASAVGAKAYTDKVKAVCNDGVHYYIIIGEKEVSLDIRSVGDGYYCTEWQRDMLERRIMMSNFYVMEQYDYFYSLLYHAILQKRSFSREYSDKLKVMSDRLSIKLLDDTLCGFVRILEKYMQKNGYTYTYPTDTFVQLNTKYIDKELLQRNITLAYRHWKFDNRVRLIELLVNIKHALLRLIR